MQKLNLADMSDSESGCYNFFRYIRNDQDVLKIAHALTYLKDAGVSFHYDPFWDQANELLLTALNGYLHHYCT